MYDYYLGGFHNFAVDRQAAEAVISANPDVPLLDHELAQRGMLLKDLVAAGVSWMTLQRLRHGTAEGRGEATTLATAYKIAAVLDPEHPEAMVKRLFEMKRRPRAPPPSRTRQARAAGEVRPDDTVS
jgi:hypothetical protein